MTKTLLVGLDAACWEYLDPLLETGDLPNLQHLMARGTWGTLASTLPALTPTAWSSIITGKHPGKHGIFDMTRRRPGSYDFVPVNAQMRLGMPFWKRLNQCGVRVGLVNIPFTYPPDAIDGFVVSGFGAPGSVPDIAYPAEALTRIEERFGIYQPMVDAKLLRSGRHAAIYEAEQAHQARLVQIAIDLAERYQVDVLVINLMLLDHINHKMPDMERVRQAIRQLDIDLGTLIKGFQPDHIMAISDHGSRRVRGDFLLHAWLRDHGYVVQREQPLSEQRNVMNWVMRQWLQSHRGWSGLHEKAIRNLACLILPHLPRKVADAFWQWLERDISFAREYIRFSSEIDFNRTLVYYGASYSGLLYLNIAGREPGGTIARDSQAEVRSRLIRDLMKIRDPDTGKELFSGVHTAEEIYDGPARPLAPDLVIDSYEAEWNILCTFRRGAYAEKVRDRYFVNSVKDFGHHSRDGIFVYAGQNFGAGPAARRVHVVDIPAILLHLYGIPIPGDYDGCPLTELMSPGFVVDNPVRYQPGDDSAPVRADDLYSEEETEQVISHLRALGYVD